MRYGVLTMLLSCAVARASAQSLESRLAAVRDGTVGFRYAARAGVCGDGDRFVRLGSSTIGSWSSGARDGACLPGPVQVLLTLRDGEIVRVQSWVGEPRPRGERDLGAVPAADAAAYLTRIAARAGAGPSSKAILPAVLADSAVVWPALLTIARDDATRSRATRQEAAFWLSRFASGATMGRRNDPIAEVGPDRDDVKAHAVFVLSQLPHEDGVPALLDVARTNKDPRVRAGALFWLGQSGDPRALALFESLLR